MTVRRRILLVGLFLVITAGIAFAYLFYRSLDRTNNAYAAWWAADLVMEYMESHKGAWPQSWDELRKISERGYRGSAVTNWESGVVFESNRPRVSIEELQTQIEIDWSANPTELMKASNNQGNPPFRVIWLRHPPLTYWSGREPNEMILRYLLWKDRNSKNAPP